MNFYEFAEILKKQNPNKIVFIKTGAFFNCIGKDAIIAEKQLGLKRTCFAKGICKRSSLGKLSHNTIFHCCFMHIF